MRCSKTACSLLKMQILIKQLISNFDGFQLLLLMNLVVLDWLLKIKGTLCSKSETCLELKSFVDEHIVSRNPLIEWE